MAGCSLCVSTGNCSYSTLLNLYTVERHLSGLTGRASHPDMQNIRIIGSVFENKLYWQFEVGKKILQAAVLSYIFICVKIKHLYIIPYMYLIIGGNI
jgi:hypothetical protein